MCDASGATRAARPCTGGAAGRRSRSTGPSSTIRPRYMTSTRSHSSATTLRLCVIRISVSPCSCAQAREQLDDLQLDGHVERRGRLVGDQQARARRERVGDHHALAHAARELVRVAASTRSGRGARRRASRSTATWRAARAAQAAMRPQHLLERRLDAVERIERRARALEDHRDLLAADAVHRAVARAPAGSSPGRGSRRRGSWPSAGGGRDRERRHRLAAAALADDAEDLAVLHLEVDAVEHVARPRRRRERRLQSAHVEDRGHAQRRFGSSRSRSPSPIRLKPILRSRSRGRGRTRPTTRPRRCGRSRATPSRPTRAPAGGRRGR